MNFIKKACDYVVLPGNVSTFESQYLQRLNRIALYFFLAHIPVLTLFAWANGTGGTFALICSTLTVLGPVVASRSWESPRAVSVVMGMTAMYMGAFLVHFGQGPVQIEMHFYFFVLLALLAVFANPMVIIAAAVTVAIHHAALWYWMPSSVFNYEAPLWVVAVHAAFVVLESVAACFIARSFFDNVIGLEKKVAERTIELERRNADMSRILNTVQEGLLTIDRAGRISNERSAAVEKLMGPIPASELLSDLLRRLDPSAADWFELGIEDVFADILPVEITLDQLPKKLSGCGKALSLGYYPIYDDSILTGVSVVVRDVTSAEEREKLESENREMLLMFESVMKDRNGFLEFLEESEDLLNALRPENRTDLATVKRNVHTLKGNTAIFGLERVSAICHQIETEIEEEGDVTDSATWGQLFCCWASVRTNLRRLMQDERCRIELDDERYSAHLMSIMNNESRERLVEQVSSWKLEPTRKRLESLADRAKVLAKRLGKAGLQVNIVDNGIGLDAEHWAKFWTSFVHVIRNAIDHAIESAEERRALGKPECGRLTLATYVTGNRFVISVSDDGRGIDWDKLRHSAKARGLDAKTNEELQQLLFADGVSTADMVTDTSGRGVGMSAVRETCESLGGTIVVSSVRNQGTEVRLEFPLESIAPKTQKMLHSMGVPGFVNAPTMMLPTEAAF